MSKYKVIRDYVSAFHSFLEGEVVEYHGRTHNLLNPVSMNEDCLAEVYRMDGTIGQIPLAHLEELKQENTEVNSTSDDRVINNVMRHNYRVLDDNEKIAMKRIKDYGLEFLEYVDCIGDSRELSLAKTKIEEAVMWAVKHITR
jgi:hypothetical protein